MSKKQPSKQQKIWKCRWNNCFFKGIKQWDMV